MASGKTHDKITVGMLPIVILILIRVNIEIYNTLNKVIVFTVIGALIYIFAGYMFSGDLDIKSREYNRWGKIKYIWLPYQKLISHRSIFSHGILLGPIIRIVYLYIIFLLISAIMYSLNITKFSTIYLINRTVIFINENKKLMFIVWISLFLGSGLHTIVDIFYSYIKKRYIFKKKRNKVYRRNKNKVA
ncbi:metal-binding protein [Clostridium carnis]